MATQENASSVWNALLGREVMVVRDRYGYKMNGDYFRRVTTLLGGIPKPALTGWAARTVAEFAVEHKDSWTDLPPTDAVKLLKGAPWSQRDVTAAATRRRMKCSGHWGILSQRRNARQGYAKTARIAIFAFP